jgi:hypothetical protein
MAGNVLDILNVIDVDTVGRQISQNFHTWFIRRQQKMNEWEEVRKYVYATDTSTTTNSSLPWKNKTTVPKLCQIRDNLYANYMASMFPKSKWLIWEGGDKDSEDLTKKQAIQNYMSYVIQQDIFKKELSKCVLDYIDYGNCFATVEWHDHTQELDDKTQVGYVGPALKRICPLDIVFNPIASSFEQSPKIVRSLVTLGEVKEYLTRLSQDENTETYKEIYDYLLAVRSSMSNFSGELSIKDEYFRVDGFDNYQAYLASDYVELLTFYGDLYDRDSDTFYRNHIFVIADRHKLICKKPNPSFFGNPPIYHCGWRTRQDNLWAMGPLDNLVGMQYRLDHVENLKADVFDLITFPPLKIKGYVEEFTWGPFERIYTGDDGDVTPMPPAFQVLSANTEIEYLQKQMEEMAGAPKEAMGFRTPGEKTAYEVQRMENAASRVFTNKISQFEEQLVENVLNAMLELARRNVTSTSVRVFNEDLKIATFMELSPDDITGYGRIRPIAARHFAERAELVQNVNNFFGSTIGQDPSVREHFSSLGMAKMFEEVLDLGDYKLITPYIRIAEAADAQRLAQAAHEQVLMEASQASGLSMDDYDQQTPQGAPSGGPPGAAQGPGGALPPMPSSMPPRGAPASTPAQSASLFNPSVA